MGKDAYFETHRLETRELQALRKQREEAVEKDEMWNPEFGTLDPMLEEQIAEGLHRQYQHQRPYEFDSEGGGRVRFGKIGYSESGHCDGSLQQRIEVRTEEIASAAASKSRS